MTILKMKKKMIQILKQRKIIQYIKEIIKTLIYWVTDKNFGKYLVQDSKYKWLQLPSIFTGFSISKL